MKIFNLTFLLLATTVLAADNDWPRFRGPNGSGISDAATVPVTWTDKDYNWKITLPGTGHSSPVIVGNRLFVTCADAAAATRIVLCLDAATGKTIWQRAFPSKPFRQNKDNSYATATPAADERGVVVAWTTPDEVVLLALDNDGRDAWKRNLGPYVGAHGGANSPIIAGDLVVLDNSQEDPSTNPNAYGKPDSPTQPGKSFVLAVERATGKTRWQLDRKTAQSSYATPCLRGGNELIVCSTANGMTGIDLATGRINWELPGVFEKRCVASPVLAGELVIEGCGSGGAGASYVAVKAGTKPEQKYELQRPLPYVPTALVKGDRLFLWGDNGGVACHRIATGELVWCDRVQGAFYSSPVCVGGRLYNVAKNGDVFVLGAGDKFELLARIPLGDPSFASPAVANGSLYLRTFTRLFSVGGRR